jgi:hypothetical protein
MINKNVSKHLDSFLYLFYLIFLVSIICSFRAISSVSIGVILITDLTKNKIETGSFLNKNLKSSLLVCCFIFYLLQAVSLFYTHNFEESIKHLRIKSAIILIPFALSCSNYLTPIVVKNLMKHFILMLSAVMLYCLAIAIRKHFFLHEESNVFFYHELVSPFKQHAVQVSILLFIGLLYLLQLGSNSLYFSGNKFFHLLLLLYFISCIILLSSKLVIIFSAICILYYLIMTFKKKQKRSLIIFSSIFICAVIALVLFTHNPVSKRFNEIASGNISLIEQKNFSPGIYFNGLQFRILQWHFVSQILTEKKAWLTGVSIGDAQTLLDQKYISTNMYVGEATNGGFLGYDTHNQFLESVLQTGIPGLLAFIAICYCMIRLTTKRKSTELIFVVILLIMYSLSESVFETQYGIILFTFFPIVFYYGSKEQDVQTT